MYLGVFREFRGVGLRVWAANARNDSGKAVQKDGQRREWAAPRTAAYYFILMIFFFFFFLGGGVVLFWV